MKLSDDELAQKLGTGKDGSSYNEQVKFEMQRRALIAQKESAVATARAASAAEKYTCATWVLILVTVVGILISLFRK